MHYFTILYNISINDQLIINPLGFALTECFILPEVVLGFIQRFFFVDVILVAPAYLWTESGG